MMDDAIENPGYGYELETIHRGSDGRHIGTMVRFEDYPLSVGRDVEMDLPNYAFFEYERDLVGQELSHVIVKAVADDWRDRITQAVYFNPTANQNDIARFWEKLHAPNLGQA